MGGSARRADFGLQKVLTIRIQPSEVATKIVDLGPQR